MPDPRLERTVASILTRAHVLERALHERGAWHAVITARWAGTWGSFTFAVPAERHEKTASVVFVVYVGQPMEIMAVELMYQAGDGFERLGQMWVIDPPRAAPARIVLDLGVDYMERAA